MKTRIVNTSIWRDEFFQSLDDKEKVIFLFLITNDKLEILPACKVNISEIAFFNNTKRDKVMSSIAKFEDLGIIFKSGWIFIKETFTYANYKGGKTQKAREKEWNALPQEIKKYIDIDGSIEQSLLNHCSMIEHINHNTETINHKAETINHKETKNFKKISGIQTEDIQEISEAYQVPESFVRSKIDDIRNYCESTGKSYKNYKATLRNWVKRDAMNIVKENHEQSQLAVAE